MFVYAGMNYTSTVSGAVSKNICCERCRTTFTYSVYQSAKGGGRSAYFLNNSGAQNLAQQRAHDNLRKQFDKIDAVSCPTCGHLQENMVEALRRQRYWWLTPLGIIAIVLFGMYFVTAQVAPADVAIHNGPFRPVVGLLTLVGVGLLVFRSWLKKQFNPNQDAATRAGKVAGGVTTFAPPTQRPSTAARPLPPPLVRGWGGVPVRPPPSSVIAPGVAIFIPASAQLWLPRRVLFMALSPIFVFGVAGFIAMVMTIVHAFQPANGGAANLSPGATPGHYVPGLNRDHKYLLTFDEPTVPARPPAPANAFGLADSCHNQSDVTAYDCRLVSGKFGKAAQFNGKSSYIDLSPTFISLDRNGSRTFTLWFKTGEHQGELFSSGAQRPCGAFNLQLGQDDKPGEFTVSGNGTGLVIMQRWKPWDRAWHFAAVVLEKGIVHFRCDDDTCSSAVLPFNTTGRDNYLGKSNDSKNPRWFWGEIDDVAVWHRALSEEETGRIYHAGRDGIGVQELLYQTLPSR